MLAEQWSIKEQSLNYVEIIKHQYHHSRRHHEQIANPLRLYLDFYWLGWPASPNVNVHSYNADRGASIADKPQLART